MGGFICFVLWGGFEGGRSGGNFLIPFIDQPCRPCGAPCGVVGEIITSAILFELFEVATSFLRDIFCY